MMGHKRKRESAADSSPSKKSIQSDSVGQPDGSVAQLSSNAPIPADEKASEILALPPLPPVPPGYLSTAPFVHESITTTSRMTAAGDRSYDRLEFLGDAYIQVISSRVLYTRFPHFPSNKLSTARQTLVRNSTLAKFSLQYQFDQRTKATKGMKIKEEPKILGDVFEAYTASVVLGDPENGFRAAEAWLSALWEPLLKQIEQAEQKPMSAANSKEALRKMIMSPGVKIDYVEERPSEMLKNKGETEYYFGCYVSGWGYLKKHIGSGTGYSKVAAGNNAALDAIENEAALQDMVKQKSVFDEKRRQEREAAA